MIKVFVNMRPDEDARTALEKTGRFEIDVVEDGFETAGREFPEDRIAGAEVLFCQQPPANLEAMGSLKLIQLSSVGYNQLEGLGLAGRGIRVCNARGVFDVPIAEWNIAMMINLGRDLREMIRNQESGTWNRADRFHRELRGATVGIWGYGGIGRETARLGKALGLKIHAMTRSKPAPQGEEIYRVPGTGDPDADLPDRIFTPNETGEFLSGLDFLVLAMPLSAENEGIVGEAELEALPGHCFVLNPARGPLIEEGALLSALRENRIAGAAIDTHYHYPMPPDHPLWHFPNVIMTPHISGSTGGLHFVSRTWDIFSQNLDRYESGKALLNEVAPQRL